MTKDKTSGMRMPKCMSCHKAIALMLVGGMLVAERNKDCSLRFLELWMFVTENPGIL